MAVRNSVPTPPSRRPSVARATLVTAASVMIAGFITWTATAADATPPAVASEVVKAVAPAPFDGEKSTWRDGFERYDYLLANPDKVACIYGENPILRSTASKKPLVDDLAPLAAAGVPILHVCGANDPSFEPSTRTAKQRYTDLGGTMTVITRDGEGHYPTSPRDAGPVVEFIAAKTR